MIESHLPMVRAIARRHAGRGEELDDLVQVGAVGLIKASDRFDPRRGVAFSAFAAPVIEGEIRRHLRDRTRAVRIPRDLERMNAKLRRQHGELASALGRSPTVAELAAALGVEKDDVERALSVERARDSVSISQSADDDTVDLQSGIEALSGSDDRLLLAAGVRVLDERERRIVFLRFHADMTERQIAREVGLSQAHVSRLLGGALAKLRKELASTGAAGERGDTTPDTVTPRDDESARNRLPAVRAAADPTLAQYLERPYHLEVRSEHDGDRSWWKATVEELPGCASRGGTADEALDRLRPAMESWLASAIAEGREIPVPGQEPSRSRTSRSHSGRFLVRMPRTLHEQLARQAERQQVSLNRFVTDVLAASVARPERAEAPTERAQAPTESEPAGADADSAPQSGPARAFRLALATNLVVVVLAGIVAVVLLVLALERGI